MNEQSRERWGTRSQRAMLISCVLVLVSLIFPHALAQPQTGTTSTSAKAVNDGSSSAGGSLQTSFAVRFMEFDNVYLALKPGAPLSKGMKLVVRKSSGTGSPVIGELMVKSVSPTSAICDVLSVRGEFEHGNVAYLTEEEIAALTKQQSLSAANNIPPVTKPKQANAESKSVAETSHFAPSQVAKSTVAVVGTAAAGSALNTQSTAGSQPQAVATASPIPVKAPPVSAKTKTAMEASSSTQGAATTDISPTTKDHSSSTAPGVATPIGQRPTVAVQSNPPAANFPPPSSSGGANTQPLVGSVQIRQAPAVAQTSPTPQTLADSSAKQVQPPSPKIDKPVAQPPAVLSASPTAPATASNPPVNDTQAAAPDSKGAPLKSGEEATSKAQEVAQADDEEPLPDVQTIFKIKFVAQDTVYLSAGTATGLTAGMKLLVKHSAADISETGTLAKASQTPTIAQLEVISVASSSAVCSVQKKTADIQPGDLAFMDRATAETLAEKRTLSSSRKYPQVVSFNEGDPLEEEVRDEVPRPPLPEVNRIRGRFGFDFTNINSVGSVASNNSTVGMVVRTDFTRIGGTYWNLSGYWRGRLTNTSYAEQPTLQDLINRTYHLNLSYSSPTSPWVAGFGRLYLPWATSLDTIDGGYLGRKEGKHVLLGVFAGSTPDPTSWDYNPDRRIGGVFLNLEGGSFDSVRVTSTSGVALSMLKWQIDRPFIFFENGLYFKRYLAIYDSTQADDPRPLPGLTAVGQGLSRNFVTVRFQPFERLSFDVNDNYFRDVPTFDTALIATGLLDKYLFQGLSTGARVEPIKHITFYASVGKSSRTGDASSSWNEMYGVTLGQIPWTGLRLDARASKFDSSFGNGNYRSISLSRNVREALRMEVQVGEQSLASQLSNQTNSHFINASLEGNLGGSYFVQGAYTVQRGGTFDYNQWTVTFGYRFDNRTLGGTQ